MSMLEDVLKGGSLPGMAVALGAALVAPAVLPAVGRALRPVAKAVIKGGIVTYRQTASALGEGMGDMVNEARAELGPEPTRKRT